MRFVYGLTVAPLVIYLLYPFLSFNSVRMLSFSMKFSISIFLFSEMIKNFDPLVSFIFFFFFSLFLPFFLSISSCTIVFFFTLFYLCCFPQKVLFRFYFAHLLLFVSIFLNLFFSSFSNCSFFLFFLFFLSQRSFCSGCLQIWKTLEKSWKFFFFWKSREVE